MLDDQVDRYLMNREHGLRYDASEKVLRLSPIFMWYAGDFTGGNTVVAFFMRGGVLDWVQENAPARVTQPWDGEDPSIKYLDYDWALNDRP